MSPSVEITESTNRRLEELQTEIRRETGRTVTKQEVVGHVVRDAFESKEAVIELFRDDIASPSDSE